MKNCGITLSILFIIAGFNLQARAQQAALTSTLEVYKITINEEGEEVAEKTETIKPGYTLQYRLTYTNNTNGAIKQLEAVLPVPVKVSYSGKSTPAIDAASLELNGPAFEPLPVRRERTLESGKVVKVKVPPSEYRRIKWVIPVLEAGESVTLTARVQVNKDLNK